MHRNVYIPKIKYQNMKEEKTKKVRMDWEKHLTDVEKRLEEKMKDVNLLLQLKRDAELVIGSLNEIDR